MGQEWRLTRLLDALLGRSDVGRITTKEPLNNSRTVAHSTNLFDRCHTMIQLSFATLDHRKKKKQTKRRRFLAEMYAVVPWAALAGSDL